MSLTPQSRSTGFATPVRPRRLTAAQKMFATPLVAQDGRSVGSEPAALTTPLRSISPPALALNPAPSPRCRLPG